MEKVLAQQGETFFYIPAAGHEAAATLAPHMIEEDWLVLHYRDRALAMQRGVSVEQFFYSAFGKQESSSAGRRMPGFVSAPNLNVPSGSTCVGNSALHAVGIAAAIKENQENPIVLCSVGDGTTQQGEFLEAVGEAVRAQLPVLFLIEDNKFALSTITRTKTFYSTPHGEQNSFYGMDIHRINGVDALAAFDAFGDLTARVRQERIPQMALFEVERLTSHTNADDETVYRDARELERLKQECDPIKNLRADLLERGIAEEELAQIEADVEERIKSAVELARNGSEPTAEDICKKPLPPRLSDPEQEYRGDPERAELTMLEAMRAVLDYRLGQSSEVTLFGEDIEDPKGDVFGLTQGLSTKFPAQVMNSPLAEATIIGSSIGRSMAGGRPVALLQFADFMPLAYNQIFSELGNMYWRTKGEWNTPVIVMAICGGYRPGLGPFHAQTPDANVAHIPGIDLFMPATAADAAGLLNAAFESERPTVFLYPKNLINDRSIMTSRDVDKHFVPIGKARRIRAGSDLTLVGWGGTIPICEQAAAALQESDISTDLIDLRSLSPWDQEAVINSARKTGKLIVVHEDTRTCGIGGEILATVAEQCGGTVALARVARSDTYVPYHFGSQMKVMPNAKRLLEKAAEMLELKITWRERVKAESGTVTVNAIGSSPSDETIRFIEILVDEGDEVAEGALLASVEADKAAMDITAPVAGVIKKIFVTEGESIKVGEPFVTLGNAESKIRTSAGLHDPGIPVIEKIGGAAAAPAIAAKDTRISGRPVLINSICAAVGSRIMHNDDFLPNFPEWTSDDVLQRTGVEKRFWIDEHEDVLSLAVKACRELLQQEQLDISEIDTIICSTGTPPSSITPSLACRILKELSPDKGETLVQAYDINAACTGWLYALQGAYDTLKYDARRRIIVVTAETLSPLLDQKDPETAFIFGDAATAALLTCEPGMGSMRARLHRPVLSAMGVEEDILRVPFMKSGETVGMKGTQVFRVAVRKMVTMLENACRAEDVSIDDLSMIVTHQANERIIEAARRMIKFNEERVFNQMREYGNTSSNTIPIALRTVIPAQQSGSRIGLTAFGGGYTFGAAVLDVL